jgi:hypothetical protein
LLFNPLISVTSSIGLDVVRTSPMYLLSSISAYPFQYPSLYLCWLLSFIFSFFLIFMQLKINKKILRFGKISKML